jgi:His-Xaa-Ser system radical SAM maturase HxsC
MLTLRARGLEIVRGERAVPRIVRLSTDFNRPSPLKKSEGYISRDGAMPDGFAWYLVIGTEHAEKTHAIPEGASAIFLPPAFAYIGDGDVVRIGREKGDFGALFQRSARHHSFLLTERCNHYCLMCSQPPRDVADDWIVDDLLAAIPLIDPDTQEIGFTGGEPTLLGDRLVRLIQQAKSYLPRTALHVLSNGRTFSDIDFANRVAGIQHHDLMFGIPIYSDLSDRHDYVVQSDGAFDETIRGILNLKRNKVPVEIRVVVHKQTFDRLPQLATFIARNLTFVDQVVFMGLEMMGFTKANLSDLWIDPID